MTTSYAVLVHDTLGDLIAHKFSPKLKKGKFFIRAVNTYVRRKNAPRDDTYLTGLRELASVDSSTWIRDGCREASIALNQIF